MSEIVIRVRNLAKLYHIGERQPYKTLRGAITNAFNFPIRKFKNRLKSKGEIPDYIWALKDVSFAIKRGEIVGIIGRNGAGKTTLLKILSRITTPTEGYVEVSGRISSLLEVGTGFHPELTGRDNIYLNGAILGMRKKEINRKFAEIVAFAEVEKFIDTPVKYYSTGMYMRLAFAVAAHLEPDILLIDEVLAVGDTVFQKKCLGKMGNIASEGRTVLFVSHNIGAIERLCNRAVLFDQGEIVIDDSVSKVIEQYYAVSLIKSAEWQRPASMSSPEKFCFISVRAKNKDGKISSMFGGDQPIVIEIEYIIKQYLPDCQILVGFDNYLDINVFLTGDTDCDGELGAPRQPGKYRSKFVVPGHLLTPGHYTVAVSADILGHMVYDHVRPATTLEVLAKGAAEPTGNRKPGIISPLIKWDTTKEE